MNSVKKIQLDWVDALKAFAILGILLNHCVESFRLFPWFSSPSYNWPAFSERMSNLIPASGRLLSDILIFLGWLGDNGPGVFILLSGLTLTLSSMNKTQSNVDFYKNRFWRIYPLYITIHLIVIIMMIFLFNRQTGLLSPITILSLAGLRFTESLFFSINPSWWFIWFILQMYLVFPYLLKLLKNSGIAPFIIITLTITLLSRGAGLLGITYSGSLMKWMMGLFGGTRLFEFSAGMLFGYLIYHNNHAFKELLSNKTKVFGISILIYLIGFLCSITYIGSLISNILISVGLSGIFYGIYYLFFSPYEKPKRGLLWIGSNSFSVFLLHQPMMIFAASKLDGRGLVLALILIVIFSFIAGYYIEQATNSFTRFILEKWDYLRDNVISKITVYHIIPYFVIIGIFSFLFPVISLDYRFNNYHLMFLALIFTVIIIFMIRVQRNFRFSYLSDRFLDIAFIISSIFLVLTANWYPLYWLFILIGFLIILLTIKLTYLLSYTITILLLVAGILYVEQYLVINKPVESGFWGERPALKSDALTGFSLIPNKITRLKYNNYDYILKTNSLGLASPEIPIEKGPDEFRIFIIGDAFTMPEGVEYEYSYPSLLEKALRESLPDKKINVINGGVTGYGPNEFLAQLNKYVGTIKPDLIINQFFINEFQEINYELHERNRRIGLDTGKSFAYYLRTAQIPAHYVGKIRGILNYEDNTYNYKKSLLFLYEKESPYYSDTVKVKMKDYFNKISKISSINNAEFLVMFVPGEIAVSDLEYIPYFPADTDINDTSIFDLELPNRITREMCHERGISFFDLTESLKNHKNQPVYFPESWHWNKEGHKVVARVLSDKCSELLD